MKKLLISLAVTSALGLTGCGGEKLEDVKAEVAAEGTLVPLSRVVFDPLASRISVPNDLLFSGSTDGTLQMPGEAAVSPNYADPQTALGALDGWSTQNPFSIELSVPGGVSLDATTVTRPESVRLVETLMGDPASPDASCRSVPRGVACKAVAQLAFGTDFVTRAVGNNIAVIPLKPLKPATTYILVLTDNLKDSQGRSIAPSTTYELVKQDLATLPMGSESQRQLQGVINSFERAVGALNIAKDSIIYTAAITTQSTSNVLATVKQLMLPSALNNNTPPRVTVADTGLLVSDIVYRGGPAPADDLFKFAKLYSGTITLPYYLADPTEANPYAPLNTRWTARCDSGAMIASLSETAKTDLEKGITDPAQMQNDAICKAASGGALRDFGIDKKRHLTKFNVIPKPQSNKTIQVQMTVPNTALGLVKPETGWPVVILQHGITSCKENMLAVTGALSAQGFATIAIDHPLHGSRGYNIDDVGADEINASGPGCSKNGQAINGNATDYMNLANLLVARDNIRQSIADMMGLRLGLNYINQQGLINTQDVQFLGHSLGALTGASMLALANTSLNNPQADALYSIKSSTLAMPGGAIANFLLESGAFGNLIKANVMLGSTALATDFKTYIGAGCGDGTNPVAYLNCASTKVSGYLTSLTTSGKTATLAAINATFSQFAFAAQTVLDAGDPNNYASALAANGSKVHVIEVVGGGALESGTSLPDQVIPNQAVGMPLAGTEPLARLIGTSAIPAQAGLVPVTRASISRFIYGDHSSILNPATSRAATAEMQRQTASFFLSRGAAVQVSDATVLKAQ